MDSENKSSRRDFLGDALAKGIESFLKNQLGLQNDFRNNSKAVQYIDSPEAMGVWYKAFNNRRNEKFAPKLFASCLSEEGVCEAVQYAKRHNLKIMTLGSIRVAPVAHLIDSSVEYMVLHFPNTEFNWLSSENISVGPFCHTDLAYHQLISKGRILPLGNGATVKLSGYTLGGGIGIFSREMGLMCDNLIGVRMVDDQGRLLDSDDHPELLWFAKGGGNETVGYFTQFRFKTHSFNPFMQTTIAHYSKSERLGALSEWIKLTKDLPNKAHSTLTVGPNECSIKILCWDEKHDGVWLDSRGQTSINESPSTFDFLGGDQLGGNYYEKASLGFFNEESDVETAFGRSLEILDGFQLNQAGLNVRFQTLGGKIRDPVSSGCFAHRQYNYLAESNCFWYRPEAETASIEALSQLKSAFGHLKAHYRNFQRSDLDLISTDYYGENLAKLQGRPFLFATLANASSAR